MNIGLDYDGTCTEDPQAWKEFVRTMKARGHTVYIVTMRYPSEVVNDPNILEFQEIVDKIIPTSRQAKQPFCENIAGITVDVWIDDTPRAVNESATQIWGRSSKEGEVIIPTHQSGSV